MELSGHFSPGHVTQPASQNQILRLAVLEQLVNTLVALLSLLSSPHSHLLHRDLWPHAAQPLGDGGGDVSDGARQHRPPARHGDRDGPREPGHHGDGPPGGRGEGPQL